MVGGGKGSRMLPRLERGGGLMINMCSTSEKQCGEHFVSAEDPQQSDLMWEPWGAQDNIQRTWSMI